MADLKIKKEDLEKIVKYQELENLIKSIKAEAGKQYPNGSKLSADLKILKDMEKKWGESVKDFEKKLEEELEKELENQERDVKESIEHFEKEYSSFNEKIEAIKKEGDSPSVNELTALETILRNLEQLHENTLDFISKIKKREQLYKNIIENAENLQKFKNDKDAIKGKIDEIKKEEEKLGLSAEFKNYYQGMEKIANKVLVVADLKCICGISDELSTVQKSIESHNYHVCSNCGRIIIKAE